jgi:Ran GTPase-activating protein (RanGAP) involved in mRNA processing and transport
LTKVLRKTLILQNYTLSIGHCNALAAACPFLPKSINRVYFDNCGIDDQEFSAILRGLAQLTDFKSIIYKRNVFDEDSLAAIIPLLHKRLPNHLEELRLIDCTIPKSICQDLVIEI